jgi:hypothetical protein
MSSLENPRDKLPFSILPRTESSVVGGNSVLQQGYELGERQYYEEALRERWNKQVKPLNEAFTLMAIQLDARGTGERLPYTTGRWKNKSRFYQDSFCLADDSSSVSCEMQWSKTRGGVVVPFFYEQDWSQVILGKGSFVVDFRDGAITGFFINASSSELIPEPVVSKIAEVFPAIQKYSSAIKFALLQHHLSLETFASHDDQQFDSSTNCFSKAGTEKSVSVDEYFALFDKIRSQIPIDMDA